eukprot:jgi/Tetstr1/428787/TSEL_018774.t1
MVAKLGPMLGHCTEGMEHKRKPIKRDGREHTNFRDFNAEYASPFAPSIMRCARRLMSIHWVETHVPRGQSNKRSKRNTFASTAERLNGASKPVKAKRDALLDEVAQLQNERQDKMNACGGNMDEA